MTYNKTKATPKERLVIAVAHLAGIVDALVYFGSVTLISTSLRADVLFSGWAEED